MIEVSKQEEVLVELDWSLQLLGQRGEEGNEGAWGGMVGECHALRPVDEPALVAAVELDDNCDDDWYPC